MVPRPIIVWHPHRSPFARGVDGILLGYAQCIPVCPALHSTAVSAFLRAGIFPWQKSHWPVLPAAVVCILFAAGRPEIRWPLGWVLLILTVLAAIAAILLGIIAISASNGCLGWVSAALAFVFLEGATGFCLLDKSEDLFWQFGLGLVPILMICLFFIADPRHTARAARRGTAK